RRAGSEAHSAQLRPSITGASSSHVSRWDTSPTGFSNWLAPATGTSGFRRLQGERFTARPDYRIDGAPVLCAHSSVGWRFSIKIELIDASIYSRPGME